MFCRLNPPANVAIFESLVDLDAAKNNTANKTSLFATTLAKASSSQNCTFSSFWQLFQQKLRPGQNFDLLLTTPITSSQTFPLVLSSADQELQLSQITSSLIGQPLDSVTSIPEKDSPSAVEVAGARKRWEAFVKEMRKPASYVSRYRVCVSFF
jgi:hypothetical protein